MGWFGNLRKVKCREKAWKGYTETEVVFSVGFFDHPEVENSQKKIFTILPACREVRKILKSENIFLVFYHKEDKQFAKVTELFFEVFSSNFYSGRRRIL
jgi:hypothetical protein